MPQTLSFFFLHPLSHSLFLSKIYQFLHFTTKIFLHTQTPLLSLQSLPSFKMSATTVPPTSSSAAEPESSPAQARLELDLHLRHPRQQQIVSTHYTAASAITPKSRSRRPLKPPPQKKQPQRGLGVAQLERLRLQERWKKLIEVPGTQQQHPSSMTASFQPDPRAVPHFQYLQAGVTGGGSQHQPPTTPFLYPVMESVDGSVFPQYETGGCCLPPGVFGMGRGFFVGNTLPGRWDGVKNEASRELSSMPNARALVPDRTDHHSIYLAAGMNGKVKPVVGGVVMEYEFFPGKRCRNTWNEAHCMPKIGGGEGGRGGTSDSSAAAEASNSIDLSLKL